MAMVDRRTALAYGGETERSTAQITLRVLAIIACALLAGMGIATVGDWLFRAMSPPSLGGGFEGGDETLALQRSVDQCTSGEYGLGKIGLEYLPVHRSWGTGTGTGTDHGAAQASCSDSRNSARRPVVQSPAYPEVTLAVSKKYKVAYVIMPKSASKTIGELTRKSWKSKRMSFIEFSRLKDVDNYFVFTFVREPLSHVIHGLHQVSPHPTTTPLTTAPLARYHRAF